MLPENERCPKCGSKDFLVARDVLATRVHCNTTWLPRNKDVEINPQVVLQLIERIEKLSEAFELLNSNTGLALMDNKEAKSNLKKSFDLFYKYFANSELE